MTTTAPLTTGWEPDVPVGDTLLRRYLFHWAACCDAYADAGGGRTHRTAAVAMADLGRPAGFFNSATLLRPLGGDLDEVLADIDGFYAEGRGATLLWSAWPTPDLTTRGWQLVGHPPLLVRPPTDILGAPPAPATHVERVVDAGGLAEWERVAVEGYPMPELAGLAPGALADPSLLDDDRLAFWVGREDGAAASIGTSFVAEGIASFALGVTRPEARRRGHWLAHAVARLEAHPDVWTTGVFSDHSRPGAEQIGFVPLVRFDLWTRPRP